MLALLVQLGLHSTVAVSQTSPAEALFGRLLEARLNALAKDPAISARAPNQRGFALMQAAGDSAIYFLDDAGLQQLSRLFGETAAHAPPRTCARLYTDGGDAFPTAFAAVMQTADSLLVDRWATFMVRMVRAGILRPTPGRIASPEEVGRTVTELVAAQPETDRPRLRSGAAKVGPVDDVCFFTVTLYRQLGALPADKVGPVFRAMMRGVRPKLS